MIDSNRIADRWKWNLLQFCEDYDRHPDSAEQLELYTEILKSLHSEDEELKEKESGEK